MPGPPTVHCHSTDDTGVRMTSRALDRPAAAELGNVAEVVRNFVGAELGKHYTVSPDFDLVGCFKERFCPQLLEGAQTHAEVRVAEALVHEL